MLNTIGIVVVLPFDRECRCGAAWCSDDNRPAADQIGRQFRQPIEFIVCPAEFYRDVPSLDVAGFGQPFAKTGDTADAQYAPKLLDDRHHLAAGVCQWP